MSTQCIFENRSKYAFNICPNEKFNHISVRFDPNIRYSCEKWTSIEYWTHYNCIINIEWQFSIWSESTTKYRSLDPNLCINCVTFYETSTPDWRCRFLHFMFHYPQRLYVIFFVMCYVLWICKIWIK